MLGVGLSSEQTNRTSKPCNGICFIFTSGVGIGEEMGVGAGDGAGVGGIVLGFVFYLGSWKVLLGGQLASASCSISDSMVSTLTSTPASKSDSSSRMSDMLIIFISESGLCAFFITPKISGEGASSR